VLINSINHIVLLF